MVVAIVAALLMTATPAAASTKLTCHIGWSGHCRTASLAPSGNGVFILGAGPRPSTVGLQVVEEGTNRVQTRVNVGPGNTWLEAYSGGFDPAKRYYLEAQCMCSGVVVSIEGR